MGLSFDARPPGLESTLGEALLAPTRIYARATARLGTALGDELHALCHITGGGISGNLPRVLPAGTRAEVSLDFPRPALFELIARGGPVEEDEMRRTFNLGVGLVAVVAAGRSGATIDALEAAGEHAWRLGSIAQGAAGSTPDVRFVG